MNRNLQYITNIILDNSSDPIFAFNKMGMYLYVNQAFAGPCLRTPEEIIGKTIWDIFPGAQGDHRFKAVKQAFETAETVVLEVKVENEKVRNFYITTVKPIIKEDGSIDTVICISKDITDRKLTEEKLDILVKELYLKSISDGLTGIFNRTHAIERLSTEIVRAGQFGSKLTLIMLDIDHFKKVNDAYGHLVGDQVLIEIAKLLESYKSEIGYIGRYGGEEFLIVLPGDEKESVMKIVEEVRAKVEDKLFTNENIKLTVSLGVAFFENEELDGFIKKADDKLYLAKKNGRNRAEY